ncbi:MAG TPA: FAD-dependent oxidoreductase, partial [Bacillota bacterium]|nr:FAD-dependent oxidoreductase [Bacillota bacterium]
MGKKIVIVGGVAGGATAAARLRRLDEFAEIIIFERGPHVSFANCGLPYYIGGVIEKKNSLLVQTPESMRRRYNIDVRVKSEVRRIFPAKKQVEVLDLSTGAVYLENYDYLVLSPGANPVVPPIPGINLSNVFTVKNVPDGEKIREYIEKTAPSAAVVIGGGFIGLEMAEVLHGRGIRTTVVEASEQVLGVLD